MRLDGVALLHDSSIRASLNDADSRFADLTAPIILCFRHPGRVVSPVEQERCIWSERLVRRGKGWRWLTGAGVRRPLLDYRV